MNILLLCTKVPFPPKDGGSLATVAFVSSLRECNFNITILAANTPKHLADASIGENNQGVCLYSVQVNTNIRFHNLILNYLFSHKPYNVLRFFSKNFRTVLTDLITKQQFDIIQLEGPHLGIYLPDIRKHSSAKVVLRAHNVEYLLWKEIAQNSFFVKKLYLKGLAQRMEAFEKEIFASVDAIIPISNRDSKDIYASFRDKPMVVIPFGINFNNYIPVNNSREKTIFFIGALDWKPNLDGLLWFLKNVWSSLNKNNAGITFHIAGRNAPEWLKSKLTIENVYFYGEVEDAKKFMNQFQIMVVPLFSGSGIRVKILEGMALKKVIITTSKGAEGINVDDGTHLLIANDPNTFRGNILKLMVDPDLRESIGEAAKAYISKEFDNLALANKTEEFYKMII